MCDQSSPLVKGQQCCVPYCQSGVDGSSVSLFGFTKDPDLVPLWRSAIISSETESSEFDEISVTKLKICERHFLESEIRGPKRKTLVPGTIPSLFPDQKKTAIVDESPLVRASTRRRNSSMRVSPNKVDNAPNQADNAPDKADNTLSIDTVAPSGDVSLPETDDNTDSHDTVPAIAGVGDGNMEDNLESVAVGNPTEEIENAICRGDGEAMDLDTNLSIVDTFPPMSAAVISGMSNVDSTENDSTPQESGTDTDTGQVGVGRGNGRKLDTTTNLKTKKKKKKGRGAPNKLAFKCSNFIKEDHKQPIFGVQFYVDPCSDEDDPLVFGTVGSNRVSIYSCSADDGKINLCQSYVDSDPEESYYTCSWTCEPENGDPLFCFAGAKGILNVLSPVTREVVCSLQGHGSSINEVKTHPMEPDLILTTSKDHTTRMWNIQTEVCVVLFGGVNGHRDEVLSVDFDILGTRIVSCGMDHSLKFWTLESEKVKQKIQDSKDYTMDKENKAFKTLPVHYPEYSTREVHRNYVDCVSWLGDLILSKSCDNQVVLWEPKQPIDMLMTKKCTSEVGVSALLKFEITLCDIWFMRFAVDHQQQHLALGNQIGKIYLYDLDQPKPMILSHSRCNSAIRQVSFSKDSRILVAVCDDGTLWRWDRAN